MQEKAIVWFVVAWLAAWVIDLLFIVANGPFLAAPVLKLIIVAICLAVVLIGLARHGWLLAT